MLKSPVVNYSDITVYPIHSKKIVLASLIILMITGIGFIGSHFQRPSGIHVVNDDTVFEKYISKYKKAAELPWEKLQPAKLLQVGVHDKSVVLLRKRLIFTGDINSDNLTNQTYDEALKQAVSQFQKNQGLEPNGQVDAPTLTALNVSPGKRLQQLQSSFSSWKDRQNEGLSDYLWINIPDFQAKLIEKNKVTLVEPIIVGKASHPTPEMSTEITEVMLNPFWIVPASLAKKNIIPKAIQDIGYLKERNIRVFDAKSKQELPVESLDAVHLENSDEYFFRQEPGPHNPLGQIKYKITNSQSIFIHDTNSTNLFNQQNRALSSGCIRLQNPFHLFRKIVAWESLGITKHKTEKILETSDPYVIKLKKPLPVFITYMTAWIDENKTLHFRDDIYKKNTG